MFESPWTRRSVLKATLAGSLVLFLKPADALESVAGLLPDSRLKLYNLHTGERVDVTFRACFGEYVEEALKELNHVLRCHYTNRATSMDIRVIEFVHAVSQRLGGKREIHIVSGYRSPEYNDLLVQQGRGVAKGSLHVAGKAIDLQIPGVDLDLVRRTALILQAGGVGYYPESGFVHLDSGRVRFW